MLRPVVRLSAGKLSIGIFLACFALLTAYIFAGVPLVPLHGDETTHIYMARDFYYQFIQHDLSLVTYRDWSTLSGEEATQQDLRLLNGTTTKYLFGLVAWSGGYALDDLNQQWSWGSGWDWNHANGHVPSDDLLWRMRIVSAALFALGIPALFLLGRAFSGQITAYSAAVLYALHPALLLNGRRAMTEGALICFTLLTVLAAVLVIHQKKWWSYALLGLVAGLTVASKHTGAVTVAAVFVACALEIFWQRQQIIRHLFALIVAGCFALGVFYALTPAWWGDPLQRIGDALQARSAFIQSQTQAFGSYPDAAAQLSGFLRQTFTGSLMYAEVPVDDFIPRQQDRIQQYEQSGLAGWHPGASLLLILFAAGLLHLLRQRNRASVVIVCWLLAMIILTLFLTPLEWQRYYLPIYPVILLIAAAGLGALVDFIRFRLLPDHGE